MEFSFRNRQKKTLRIELFDGEKLTLPEPPVSVYKKMISMGSNMEGNEIDSSLKLVSEILNTNLEGKKFNPKSIVDNWTMGDISDLIQTYVEFAAGIKSEKN